MSFLADRVGLLRQKIQFLAKLQKCGSVRSRFNYKSGGDTGLCLEQMESCWRTFQLAAWKLDPPGGCRTVFLLLPYLLPYASSSYLWTSTSPHPPDALTSPVLTDLLLLKWLLCRFPVTPGSLAAPLIGRVLNCDYLSVNNRCSSS